MMQKRQLNSFLTAFIFLLMSGLCHSADKNPPSVDASIQAIDKFIAEQKIDKTSAQWKTGLSKPPMLTFDSKKEYLWHLKTNKGDITAKLYPKVAPMHVSSTIYLTRLGFYDHVVFHRVIPEFMAQGGDPTGTGRGGPGYMYAGEFDPNVRHSKPGLLSMANRGPDTDGSQFFITFVKTPWLDGNHSIFGEVISGFDTLKAMEKLGSRSGKTAELLEIVSATIEVK